MTEFHVRCTGCLRELTLSTRTAAVRWCADHDDHLDLVSFVVQHAVTPDTLQQWIAAERPIGVQLTLTV